MSPTPDEAFMTHALNLARQGLGRTWPNPSVGCVIVKDGTVITAARTADGGRPHAEYLALKQAGPQAKGATIYVTLEPCAHEGATPSCARLLAESGASHVILACTDPDPRTKGQGVKTLESAGLKVTSGVLENDAQEVNQGFILRLTKNRPWVTLKVTTSADGKIAAAAGERTQISGPLAARRVHQERSRHDAILIGINTALTDDPLLTTRLPGLEHTPVRIVLDTNLRLPPDSQLAQTANKTPLWVLHNAGEDQGKDLEEKGAKLFQYDGSIKSALNILAAQGITRLLVEGGAKIHTSFLQSGLYDRLLHFKNPDMTLGPQAVDALRGHDITQITTDFPLKHQKTQALGQDLLDIYANSA